MYICNMELKLKFINAEDTDHNAKATVHVSGKLGFSSGAVDYLQITEEKTIQFALNEDDETDMNLYAVTYDGAHEGAYRICKAGDYYYVNTKNLFDSLEYDYKKTKIIYDITKGEYEGTPIIKMIRRDITKKKKGVPTI